MPMAEKGRPIWLDNGDAPAYGPLPPPRDSGWGRVLLEDPSVWDVLPDSDRAIPAYRLAMAFGQQYRRVHRLFRALDQLNSQLMWGTGPYGEGCRLALPDDLRVYHEYVTSASEPRPPAAWDVTRRLGDDEAEELDLMLSSIRELGERLPPSPLKAIVQRKLDATPWCSEVLGKVRQQLAEARLLR